MQSTRFGEHVVLESHPRDSNTSQAVRVELVIARQARLNALDSALITCLIEALEHACTMTTARVVVLRAAPGKGWIGGADINEMRALTPATARTFIEHLHQLCSALRAAPLPVVAVIDGYCLGAGLEVAACCDLRLSGPGSTFAMPEVRLGIPSVIDAALLPRLIGAGRARDLVLTGRSIDAGEAHRIGLIDGLAQAGQLDALVNTRVGELANATAQALQIQKALCRAWDEVPYAVAVQRSVDAFASTFKDSEPGLRMNAFAQRKR